MITYNLQPQIHSNLLNSKRVNIINPANRLLLDKEKGKYLPCYMVATISRAFSTNKVETKNISYKKLSRLTEEKNLSNFQFSELVFTGIINILKNNPINQNTQIKIERFVRNQFSDFFENKNKDITLGLGIDKNKVNKEFIDFMFNINNELSNLFKKRKKILHDTQFSNIKKLSNPKLFQYIFKDIFSKVKIKDFVEIVLYILMFIVTHSNIFMDDEGVEHNNKTSIINISLFAPQASKMVFDKFIQNSTIILNEEAKDNSENEAEEVEAV